MAAKHKITVTMQPTAHRPSSAERRAAQTASLTNQQAELKQQAADRRAQQSAAAKAPLPPTVA